MAIAQTRRFGILLVLVATVMWSMAGLFVRMADMDIWSFLGWRSVFTTMILGGWLAHDRLHHRTVARSFGLPGFAMTAISVLGNLTYIAALTWTSVANVMTIYATLPFLAGLIAYLWLRERVSARFVIAGLVAFAGVCTMVGAAFAPRDLMGIIAAAIMTLCFATQLVVSRRYPTLDTLRMVTMGAALCLIIALPFMQTGIPSAKSLLACALYGGITTGLGYILVLIGSRIIGAGEAGFLSILDVVLGPVWVWAFYAEQVTRATLVGGTAVLLAVIWYLAGSRAADPAPETDLAPEPVTRVP